MTFEEAKLPKHVTFAVLKSNRSAALIGRDDLWIPIAVGHKGHRTISQSAYIDFAQNFGKKNFEDAFFDVLYSCFAYIWSQNVEKKKKNRADIKNVDFVPRL